MLERRNSDRLNVNVWVKEENGDYQFSFRCADLSEEGVFLEKKLTTKDNEAFSRLTFTLPNGKVFCNITARIVREHRNGKRIGAALEFLNMSEKTRIDLKQYLYENTLRGTA